MTTAEKWAAKFARVSETAPACTPEEAAVMMAAGWVNPYDELFEGMHDEAHTIDNDQFDERINYYYFKDASRLCMVVGLQGQMTIVCEVGEKFTAAHA